MKKTMKMSMKKTMKNMLSMAAAVLAAVIMTACAGSDELTDTLQQPENQNRVITLTTTVGLGADAADAGAETSGASAGTSGDSESVMRGAGTTRALTSGGVKTFAAGETMALVYENMSNKRTVKESEPLTPGDIAEGGKSATFTFRLTEEPNKTAPVRYIYPAAMAKSEVAADAELDNAGTVDFTKLNAQDGTMGSLASSLDLATYTDAWDGGNLPGGTLANQLAILAITLKNSDGSSDITSSITSLTLSDGTDTYTVNRSAAAGPIYVAIKPQSSTTFYVSATDGTNAYTKTLAGRQYAAGNGYNVGWQMAAVAKSMPLTMEALTDGNIVVFDPQDGMKYSKNGGAKTTMTETTSISVSAGDKVQFYGNGTSITCYYGTSIAGGSAKVKVYGNIMSLLNETDFATATTLTAKNEYTFLNLFSYNTTLTDASGLLLPATTLAQYCYASMFKDCTGLTTAPALPATTLATSCYTGMFSGCSSLTDTPADDILADLGDGTLYVLGQTIVDGQPHFGFHHYTATEMPARKAFVLVPAAPGSNANALTRGISIEFGDDATGIRPTPDPSLNNGGEWYDLSGRRLGAKPTKSGLYIYKGRKVAIK